ncbi:MAG: hypothetical protein WA190_17685 [Usitatibacter sp.]
MKRKVKTATEPRCVIANRTWAVDRGAIENHLKHIEVTGPRPCWAFDLATLFLDISVAIDSGSPEARVWAIAQLRVVAEAFDPDCLIPEGI